MFRAITSFLLGFFIVGGVIGLFIVIPIWLAIFHTKLAIYALSILVGFGIAAWLHDLGEEIRSTW